MELLTKNREGVYLQMRVRIEPLYLDPVEVQRRFLQTRIEESRAELGTVQPKSCMIRPKVVHIEVNEPSYTENFSGLYFLVQSRRLVCFFGNKYSTKVHWAFFFF